MSRPMEISEDVKLYAYDDGAVRYVEICVPMLWRGDKVGDIATHELRNMAYGEELLPSTPTRCRRWSTSFRMKHLALD